MEYKITEGDTTIQIQLEGQFTFSDHNSFKNILECMRGSNVRNIILNLSYLSFLDSAALGMLLLLKDESERHNIALSLHSPVGQVKKMFDLSKFDQLFTITY